MKTPESVVEECVQVMNVVIERAQKERDHIFTTRGIRMDSYEVMTNEEKRLFGNMREEINRLWPSIIKNAKNRIKEKRLKASRIGD